MLRGMLNDSLSVVAGQRNDELFRRERWFCFIITLGSFTHIYIVEQEVALFECESLSTNRIHPLDFELFEVHYHFDSHWIHQDL